MAPLAPRLLFAALANDTRLRLLLLLLAGEELCVCELTQLLGLPQPQVSRHLAQLRELKLVRDRRAGWWVYYRIEPELPAWARHVLQEIAAALRSQPPFADDARALAARPPADTRCV